MRLYGRVLVILESRGITPQPGEFVLRQDSEIEGPKIVAWALRLGPQPTPAELALVAENVAETAAFRDKRKRALANRQLQALALATFRLVRLHHPNSSLTLAAWRAMLEQAWDDIGGT